MILNSDQLALVRNTEHNTNLYISIYEPATVLACQVNNSGIAKGARVIPYNNITAGSGAFVEPDMLMLIGSATDDDLYGSIRVKGISGSDIFVAENSDIQWADDQYLTVLNYVAPAPIFPRIIQDPNNEEEVIFFKDFDIPYSNQNSVLGTFVCAGPHRAGFITTGSYSVNFTASGSNNVKGDALTYSWIFGGNASITGSTSRDPGRVSWSTPGHKSVRLIVSNASGGSDTVYRYVSVYDRPTEGNTLPLLKWEFISFSENRSEGGVTAKVRVFQILPNLRKHSLVVLWTEDWFGDTKVSLGGNYPNASDIFFNGYVQDGSIHYNYKESYTEFEITSLTNVMKDIENFPISTESSNAPDTWFEILNMNPPRALYHFLRWHSTFLKIADVHYLDTTIQVQYFDSGRESMYDSLHTFCKTGMIGSIVSDRQGTIWIEKAPEGKTSARTAYQIPLYLQKHDWVGEPDITERLKANVSYVELGGIAYTGPTGTSLAYIGCAPGIAPSIIGSVESNQGLILSSQEELNQLAGNVYAYRNSKYPSASFVMKGNYRNLDIAPLENIPITIDAADTVRGVQLTNEPFHIQSMDWRYNAEQGFLYIGSINLAQLTNGVIGDTITIPVIPPTDIIIPPFPPISFPPLPPIQIPEVLITGSIPSPEVVLIVDRNAGILVTTNFDEEYPIWLPFNNGMTSGTYTKIGSVHMTPGGQLYVLTLESSTLTSPIDGEEMGGTDLWYAPYFGSSFGQVLPNNTIKSYLGGSATRYSIASLGVDPTVPNAVAMFFCNSQAVGMLLYGSPEVGFFIRYNSTDMKCLVGSQWTAGCYPMTYGDGKWALPVLRDNLFSNSRLAVFSADLSSRTEWVDMNANGFSDARPVLTVRVAETGRLYFSQHGNGDKFKQSLNNGTTVLSVSQPGDIPTQYWQAMNCDETGQYLMRCFEAGAPDISKKSSDYGATWSTITGSFISENHKRFVNALSSYAWIAARSRIDLTLDFGENWINKNGNLLALVPSPQIMQVIVVQ